MSNTSAARSGTNNSPVRSRSATDMSTPDDDSFAALINEAGLSHPRNIPGDNEPLAAEIGRLSIDSTSTDATDVTFYRPPQTSSKVPPQLKSTATGTEPPDISSFYLTRDKWHKKGTSNPSLSSLKSRSSESSQSSTGRDLLLHLPTSAHSQTEKFRKPTDPAPKSSKQTAMEAEIKELREKLALERAKRKQTEALLFQMSKANRSANSTKTSSQRHSTTSVTPNSSVNSGAFQTPSTVDSSSHQSFGSFVADGDATPNANEKFYQSTSLFTPPARMSTPHDHTVIGMPKRTPVMPRPKPPAGVKPPAWFVPAVVVRNGHGSRNGSASSTSSLVQIGAVPSLQECLMTKKRRFLFNSRLRQSQIQSASLLRAEADAKLRELAREKAEGRLSLPPPYAIYRLEEVKRSIRAFDNEQMTKETRKKYLKLPEIQQQKKISDRQMEYKINRIQAQMFKQQLLYKMSLRTGKQLSSG